MSTAFWGCSLIFTKVETPNGQEREQAEDNFGAVVSKAMPFQDGKVKPWGEPKPTATPPAKPVTKKPAAANVKGKGNNLNSLILQMMEKEKKIKRTLELVLHGD